MRWVWSQTSKLDGDATLGAKLDISQTIECETAWDHESLKDGMLSGRVPQWMMKDAMESLANNEECLVDIIAELCHKEVQNYDLQVEFHLTLPKFIGKKPPVTVKEFIARMKKYSHASACNYVAGWIYLQRLKRRVPGLCLNSYNFQRLLTVATMLAAKLFDDSFFCNRIWAKIGGLGTDELNKLEIEMLELLDWRMGITVEEYEACRDLLCRVAWGSNADRPPDEMQTGWSSCPASPTCRLLDDGDSSEWAAGALYRSWSSEHVQCREDEEYASVGDDYFPVEASREDWRVESSFDSTTQWSARGLGASFDWQAAGVKGRGLEQSFDSSSTVRSQCSTPQASAHFLHLPSSASLDKPGSIDISKTVVVDGPKKKMSLGSSFDPYEEAPDEPGPVTGRLSILVPGGLDLMLGMC